MEFDFNQSEDTEITEDKHGVWAENVLAAPAPDFKQEKGRKVKKDHRLFKCHVCGEMVTGSEVWGSALMPTTYWCSSGCQSQTLKLKRKNWSGAFANIKGSTFKRIDGAWYKLITVKPRNKDAHIVYVKYRYLPDN